MMNPNWTGAVVLWLAVWLGGSLLVAGLWLLWALGVVVVTENVAALRAWWSRRQALRFELQYAPRIAAIRRIVSRG